MATLFYVRDGTGRDRTNGGHEMSPSTVDATFPSVRLVRLDKPPTFIDGQPANAVADFTHVVLHVAPHETQGRFNKSGYWVLQSVRPSDIASLLPRP